MSTLEENIAVVEAKIDLVERDIDQTERERQSFENNISLTSYLTESEKKLSLLLQERSKLLPSIVDLYQASSRELNLLLQQLEEQKQQQLDDQTKQKSRIFIRHSDIKYVNFTLLKFVLDAANDEEDGGIRQYLVRTARNIGVTGYVERNFHNHLSVRYDGNAEQIGRFKAVLDNLVQRHICSEIIPSIPEVLKEFEEPELSDFVLTCNHVTESKKKLSRLLQERSQLVSSSDTTSMELTTQLQSIKRSDSFEDFNLETYDIWTESSRSATEQTEFKEALINYYKRKSILNICYNKIRCMATDVLSDYEMVIACHIWKQYKQGVGLPNFGLSREDSESPRNGLLLLRDIELKFDVKELCFIYNPFHSSFIIKILNPGLMSVTIANSKGKQFADIHNKRLSHPAKTFPFRKLLSFHAQCSYKSAREKGWITQLNYDYFVSRHNLSETASVTEIASVPEIDN